MNFGPLVDAAWLREHIADADVCVIDFRWYLQGRSGRDEYAKGHIPGAVFVDLDDVTGKEGGGRHPLPAAGQFEREMRKAGVSRTTRVVVYDDAGASVAARLWFLLGYFGRGAQAVLDGGIQAWGGRSRPRRRTSRGATSPPGPPTSAGCSTSRRCARCRACR